MNKPDSFKDLEYLGNETLEQLSEKQKRDMRLTRKITKVFDWVLLGAVSISAIGFSAYQLAPEKTSQIYNTIVNGITNLYQTFNPNNPNDTTNPDLENISNS